MTTEDKTLLDGTLARMSDAMLVSVAKSGDAAAFIVLSKRHSRRVLQTTYRLTGNLPDAEDALQETLLSAFLHLNDFQGKSSFPTWLTRIAINSAFMILRKRRSRLETSIEGTDGSARAYVCRQVEAPMDDPEEIYSQKERGALLEEAIFRLPPVSRAVVELWKGGEHSAQEIAQALEISVPAVKSRLSRARSRLRATLVRPRSQPESSQTLFPGPHDKAVMS
jgi:RNA polymerase sigma-70 factor, ECF subfamily